MNKKKQLPAKKRGRPPIKCTTQIMDDIVEWISNGGTLRAWCRLPDKPCWSTVYTWMNNDDVFFARIAKSRKVGFDSIAEEILEIVDEKPPVDDKGRIDTGFVSWQKSRAWTRLQLLAKWDPKRFGNAVNLNQEGWSDNPLMTLARSLQGSPLPMKEN